MHSNKPDQKEICEDKGKGVGPWGFDVAEHAYKWDGLVYQPAGKNA